MRLDPITDGELPALIAQIEVEYARQKVEQGGWPVEEARKAAIEETAESFPEGRPLPGHEVYLIRDDHEAPDAEPSGLLWVGALQSRPRTFFIYDLLIRPEARGRGWGRAAMEFAEQRDSARNCNVIRLHVFGGNTRALDLYRSMGYEATDLYLDTPLDPAT
ncbi:GNAT family N-acetyltransferase [Aestuariimicrobium ganziense]|uniref:GNAT family N-acetyltransferase n=1 Tax=Aestuariimicrobium ganziense TaxID=2773677 RepID=UPI0019444348|nr:GNAT family N-acetyltransferase [Aestuariimicrobium ganziense]